MPAHKSTTLNTGAEMPTLGLGTWKSRPGEVEKAVEHALKVGYRHLDTATRYGNENEVGMGIKASGVARDEIFLTTKLNNPDHRKVDGPDKERDWRDTWRDMEKVFKAHPDKLKAIGVSNFSVTFLRELLKIATVVPAVNQIESHPRGMQEDIVEECRKHGIVVTAYSPLGSDKAPLMENDTVKRIAEQHNVSPANVLISLHANRPGVNVVPKSVTAHRIEANAKIVDLTEEEVRELAGVEKSNHKRFVTPYWIGWDNIGFPDLERA
ncbi:Aldo/keto reductase [Earliella scabrosa]|nr:Aldo/keto reductase [Earliella scabrosa]